MNQYEHKVAVVTGASAGIGANITEMLLDNGITVVGLARGKEKIEEITQKRSFKGTLHALKCDVTKPEEIINSFKWIEENVGPLTILINNAGISGKNNIIDGVIKDWKDTIDTNLIGASVTCREAIFQMTKNNIDGIIINIGSTAGHQVDDVDAFDMYIASKHGLKALSESIRLHLLRLNSKIRVSSVSPGIVETDIWVSSGVFTKEEFDKNFKTTLPFLNVEDVTNAVKYILSNPPHVKVVDVIIKPIGQK
ncbi:farnesol dehydrogenase-like [Onthophagus taurus]|uniref:farnesol dehydrogenase-like n=1 Tax=Onthophagus taurus TaxID=166361 RepID=UPI000C206021|nr:farnesol dehydrogenase-like [Onthophagus taurus]